MAAITAAVKSKEDLKTYIETLDSTAYIETIVVAPDSFLVIHT